MGITAEDRVVVDEGGLDLVVARHGRAFGQPELPRCLSLGERPVTDTVFGDEPGRDLRDTCPLMTVGAKGVVPLRPAATDSFRVSAAIAPGIAAHF